MTILNPHKEQAILRRILGPNALDWLKNRKFMMQIDVCMLRRLKCAIHVHIRV